MTTKANRLLPRLLIVLLSAQLPLAACASTPSELKSEAPTVDTSPATLPETTQTPMLLTGEVHKADSVTTQDANSNSQTFTQSVQTSSANLQGETATKDAPPPYVLALNKLAARAKLTSDDYRSLGIGVLGYESDRTYFTKEARISIVYPGLPAAEAGIKVGDREIYQKIDDSKVTDPTRPSWMFSCGIAGQSVDITIKHHGQLRDVHLVRMNMEDIQDPNLRRTYEELVQKLGSSSSGTIEEADVPKPPSSTAKSLLKAVFKIGTGV
jgi:C-terminal processing protease CtpA/Prc